MSLKTRLLVLIVLVVTVVVTLLSAIHLTSLVQNWSSGVWERAELAARQVQSLVVQRIQEKAATTVPPPANFDDMKLLWMRIVSEDKGLAKLIIDTVSHAKMIVEINVAGEGGEILASSNPSNRTGILRKLPKFSDWVKKDVLEQLIELRGAPEDYEVTVPLGVPRQKLPIMTVQVVVSTSILRPDFLPEVYRLGIVSIASLLASIILGIFSANLAIGPLASISEEIDRIASGTSTGPSTKDKDDPVTKTRELAIVQSKLSLLGQQIRGAQEDVTQMRSNIESLMLRMDDAVLLFDKKDTLIMAGVAAQRLLEVSRQDIIGRKMDELFPPTEPLGSIIHQAVRLGNPTNDYLVNLEREGKQAMRLLVTVDHLADQSGTMITLRDAESRRQLATQLDISRRLSAISRLTGGVAHEIKNPLNSIALRLELLRSRAAESGPEAEEEINIISQEIRRLDRVVKTFLDFTRPVDLAMEDVDVAGLAREVTALVRPQATLQKVNMLFSAEPQRIVIRGDRDLLKQALLNVVMNGIEAMKGGGNLIVKAQSQGAHCLLTIQDEGPGIDDASRSKVFQLYFTTKEKGSGIGLAMTFRAVQLHNGTIDFASEAGKGTVFRLRFPLPAEAA